MASALEQLEGAYRDSCSPEVFVDDLENVEEVGVLGEDDEGEAVVSEPSLCQKCLTSVCSGKEQSLAWPGKPDQLWVAEGEEVLVSERC